MSINISAAFLDKMSFFSLYFALWIAVTETFPISSNPSSHWPGRYVKHRMGSFAYASSTTYFACQNCAVSQRYFIAQLCTLSRLWWVTVMEKMLTTVVSGERELLMAIFWRNLKVYNQNVREDDGFPHAVCNTCHYRVEAMWKKASAVNPGHHLSKRRHPLSALTSSQVDKYKQTASQISKKKGYRIPFENVPIRPKPLALVM